MRLRHIHFRSPIPYSLASRLQGSIVEKFLSAKATQSQLPLPTIITAQFNPVYTLGRREKGSLSEDQKQFLSFNGQAAVHYALRGGQTTFHGPGQMVAYPILNLRTYGLTPRTYICMLEKSLIATCARYGVEAMTTEHTGVWTTEDDKIAAIGVHMRRFVTSHGVALNVNTDLAWFRRIVACGLVGKNTTSLEKEGVEIEDDMVSKVGEVFVEEVANRIGGKKGVSIEFEEQCIE